jgi:hypothetical protein
MKTSTARRAIRMALTYVLIALGLFGAATSHASAIGVSGAASAEQGEEIALAGAGGLESPGPGGQISYFGAKDVAAAFAQVRR